MPTIKVGQYCKVLDNPADFPPSASTFAYVTDTSAITPTTNGLGLNSDGVVYKVPLSNGDIDDPKNLVFKFTFYEQLALPFKEFTSDASTTIGTDKGQNIVPGDARLFRMSTESYSGSNTNEEPIAFFPTGIVQDQSKFYIISGVKNGRYSGPTVNSTIFVLGKTPGSYVYGPYFIRTTAWNLSSSRIYYFISTTYVKNGPKFYLLKNGTDQDVNLATTNLSNVTRFAFEVVSSMSGLTKSGVLKNLPLGSTLQITSTSEGIYSIVAVNGTYQGVNDIPSQDPIAMNAAYARNNIDFNILQIYQTKTNFTGATALAISKNIAEPNSSPALATSLAINNPNLTVGIQPTLKTQRTATLGVVGPSGAPTISFANLINKSPALTTVNSVTTDFVVVTVNTTSGGPVLGLDSSGNFTTLASYFSFGAISYDKGYFAFIPGGPNTADKIYTMTTGDFKSYVQLSVTAFNTTSANNELTTLLRPSTSISPTTQSYTNRPGVWEFDNPDGTTTDSFYLKYTPKDTVDIDGKTTKSTPLYLVGTIDDNLKVYTWSGSKVTTNATKFSCLKCSPLNGYCIPTPGSSIETEFVDYMTLKSTKYYGSGDFTALFVSTTIVEGTRFINEGLVPQQKIARNLEDSDNTEFKDEVNNSYRYVPAEDKIMYNISQDILWGPSKTLLLNTININSATSINTTGKYYTFIASRIVGSNVTRLTGGWANLFITNPVPNIANLSYSRQISTPSIIVPNSEICYFESIYSSQQSPANSYSTTSVYESIPLILKVTDVSSGVIYCTATVSEVLMNIKLTFYNVPSDPTTPSFTGISDRTQTGTSQIKILMENNNKQGAVNSIYTGATETPQNVPLNFTLTNAKTETITSRASF